MHRFTEAAITETTHDDDAEPDRTLHRKIYGTLALVCHTAFCVNITHFHTATTGFIFQDRFFLFKESQVLDRPTRSIHQFSLDRCPQIGRALVDLLPGMRVNG